MLVSRSSLIEPGAWLMPTTPRTMERSSHALRNPIGETITMRKGLLGSLLVFLGGAPLASAQGYLPYPPAYYAPMPAAWPMPQQSYPYGYAPQAYPTYAPAAYPNFRPRPPVTWGA